MKRLGIILSSMKQRCNNPNSPSFKHYGKRGINICEEWLNSKDSFIKWAMANGYQDHLEIDRRNPRLGYFPENCRWVTREFNLKNKANKIHFMYKYKFYTIPDFCAEYKIPYGVFRYNIRKGMSLDDIIKFKSK